MSVCSKFRLFCLFLSLTRAILLQKCCRLKRRKDVSGSPVRLFILAALSFDRRVVASVRGYCIKMCVSPRSWWVPPTHGSTQQKKKTCAVVTRMQLNSCSHIAPQKLLIEKVRIFSLLIRRRCRRRFPLRANRRRSVYSQKGRKNDR